MDKSYYDRQTSALSGDPEISKIADVTYRLHLEYGNTNHSANCPKCLTCCFDTNQTVDKREIGESFALFCLDK